MLRLSVRGNYWRSAGTLETSFTMSVQFLIHDNRFLHDIFQWFIGRELNPRIGPFEIKAFNELRPGLILWVLINISLVCEQATRRGGLANVTDSMWLVLAFQTWYVADGLYNEVCDISSLERSAEAW